MFSESKTLGRRSYNTTLDTVRKPLEPIGHGLADCMRLTMLCNTTQGTGDTFVHTAPYTAITAILGMCMNLHTAMVHHPTNARCCKLIHCPPLLLIPDQSNPLRPPPSQTCSTYVVLTRDFAQPLVAVSNIDQVVKFYTCLYTIIVLKHLFNCCAQHGHGGYVWRDADFGMGP
jgi:hypothetical protein